MKYNILGKTGLSVSKLCFGTLTIGPLQKNLPISDGVEIIEKAVECGVNFIDTADIYGTYPYIRQVLKHHNDIIVATKSYSYDEATARQALERALVGIGRDYIDVFLLHEMEGPLTLKGHREALDYFIEKKREGVIRAVGISAHYVAAVAAAAMMDEIDVIHPILNYKGMGIADGNVDNMLDAVRLAYNKGKGIYAMKVLGGGHLIPQISQALEFVLACEHLHSIALGMQRIEEVYANVAFFESGEVEADLTSYLKNYNRKIFIHDWCDGCGACVRRCPFGALFVEGQDKPIVDSSKCMLCGYCGLACPQMAIKVL